MDDHQIWWLFFMFVFWWCSKCCRWQRMVFDSWWFILETRSKRENPCTCLRMLWWIVDDHQLLMMFFYVFFSDDAPNVAGDRECGVSPICESSMWWTMEWNTETWEQWWNHNKPWIPGRPWHDGPAGCEDVLLTSIACSHAHNSPFPLHLGLQPMAELTSLGTRGAHVGIAAHGG